MRHKYRLACVTKNGTNPAYEGARIGASRVAQRMGCSVQHHFPNTPDDIDEQREILEAVINDRPDAIILAPTHPTALNDTIRKAEEAGIPLVFLVSRAEGINASSFVTSNNHALALTIAEYLIEKLDGKGGLVVIEGSSNSATSAPRTQGFIDAVAAHPQVHIIAQEPGNYQSDDAYQAMENILQQHPKIDGVLSANDFMAMGVMQAMAEADRYAPIVGVNAMPGAIQAIKAGKMEATAAFDAMKMACAATEAAIRVLEGSPVPDCLELPVEIVDATNCSNWDRPYEERSLPIWEDVTVNAQK